MDKTPKLKKNLACRNRKVMNNNNDSSALSSNEDNDYSPNFAPCTQEGVDVDVVWDWNSPHSKKQQKWKQKRIVLESPKLTLKKHPSNSQIQTFDKLKVELEAFRNQLIESDIEVLNQKQSSSDNEMNINVTEHGVDDFFDDSFDQELVLCSQKEEQKLAHLKMKTNTFDNDSKKLNDVHKGFVMNIKTESNFPAYTNMCASKANDSFDFALEVFNDEDFDLLSQADKKYQICNESSTRFITESSVKKNTISFNEKLPSHNTERTGQSLEQVDTNNKKIESPIKCSPEQIEQKRIEAKAKLEAKMKQDIINRNRQEALKRLEINRRKRALDIKQDPLPTKLINR